MRLARQNMWDYQIIKGKFFRLAQYAENNVRKDKLEAPKIPPVYESLHDISLAQHDVYAFLAMRHYPNKQDFINALKKQIELADTNSNAFDAQRYAKARDNYFRTLLAEYQ